MQTCCWPCLTASVHASVAVVTAREIGWWSPAEPASDSVARLDLHAVTRAPEQEIKSYKQQMQDKQGR